jgi:hypothetical protein
MDRSPTKTRPDSAGLLVSGLGFLGIAAAIWWFTWGHFHGYFILLFGVPAASIGLGLVAWSILARRKELSWPVVALGYVLLLLAVLPVALVVAVLVKS